MAIADAKVEAGDATIGDRSGLLGDCLALVAAALYACYTVTMRAMLPENSEAQMFAFFGYMGLINVVIFAPFLFLLQLVGSYDIMSVTTTAFSLSLVKGAL